MKDKFVKFIHSRVFVVILVSLLILITTFIGTYAWFTWSNPSNQNTSFTMSIGEIADVTFENGNDINGALSPVYNYYDGLSTSFVINKVSTASIEYEIIFNITSIDDALISENVKYALLRNDEIVSEGDMSNSFNGANITLSSGVLNEGSSTFEFYLYLDGNILNDDNMMNKNITGNILIDARVIETAVEYIEDYIRNLYSSSNPTLITHRDEAGNKIADYYYASSVNLMNDGLGATVNDTTALTSGTQGNIRYYGANPNNYVYFNCDDYSNQSDSTCEKWRIIGIVDGKVKIIRDESLGDYAWDYAGKGIYDNNWHSSTLRVLLNNGYYNNDDGVSYKEYSASVGVTSITINFKTDNMGIKNDDTRSMISESTWYLGGYSSSSIYVNDIYGYERGTAKCSSCTYETTWTGKIGLIYPSDYGYSADLSVCNQTLKNYNTTNNCKGTDWLFTSDDQWLITPDSSTSNYAWIVRLDGYVGYYYGVYDAYGVRAVLYLDSELVFSGLGDGSYDTPYQIEVS